MWAYSVLAILSGILFLMLVLRHQIKDWLNSSESTTAALANSELEAIIECEKQRLQQQDEDDAPPREEPA